MQDPTLGADAGGRTRVCKAILSSTFTEFTDYEEVLREAQKIAEIMTGAMKIREHVTRHKNST